MRILVTVKQVPDTAEVRIDPKTNVLMREGVPSIVNPEDLHAVELALELRQRCGGSVTALSMGPPQAREALEDVLTMGVDRAVLLSDRAFAGADTLVTAHTLAAAVRALGGADLILCGRQAIDGDTAQVGPQLAGFLQLPQVTYACAIEPDGQSLLVTHDLEDVTEQVRVSLPALVTVTDAAPDPRLPSLEFAATAAADTAVEVWSAETLGVDPQTLGLAASPTGVVRIFQPERVTDCEMIDGDETVMVRTLLQRLQERGTV